MRSLEECLRIDQDLKETLNKLLKFPLMEALAGRRSNSHLMRKGTTISVNASHASYVSYPDEITELILNATKGSNR